MPLNTMNNFSEKIAEPADGDYVCPTYDVGLNLQTSYKWLNFKQLFIRPTADDIKTASLKFATGSPLIFGNAGECAITGTGPDTNINLTAGKLNFQTAGVTKISMNLAGNGVGFGTTRLNNTGSSGTGFYFDSLDRIQTLSTLQLGAPMSTINSISRTGDPTKGLKFDTNDKGTFYTGLSVIGGFSADATTITGTVILNGATTHNGTTTLGGNVTLGANYISRAGANNGMSIDASNNAIFSNKITATSADITTGDVSILAGKLTVSQSTSCGTFLRVTGSTTAPAAVAGTAAIYYNTTTNQWEARVGANLVRFTTQPI